MKLEAYTDLVKSNMDVLVANVTMAMETLEDDNKNLIERVFKLEKENMRLVTENRMMKEECNHLKAEVIKLIDANAKPKTDVVDCTGCNYNCDCPPEWDGDYCPDCGCCKDHYKATESDTNETH